MPEQIIISTITIATQERCDVNPKEIAAFYGINKDTAITLMKRGYLIVPGDFPCVQLGKRTWRGYRLKWEEIKRRSQKN
jgi:hypothetical protein